VRPGRVLRDAEVGASPALEPSRVPEELGLVEPLDTAGAAPGRADVAVLVFDVEGAWSEPAGRAVVLDTRTEGAALATEPAAGLLIGSLVVALGSCMTL
jgi:hypothetical protein